MLFSPLPSLVLFLLPLLTAANTAGLNEFRHGFILEYRDDSVLAKRDDIYAHVARHLPGVQIDHRMDLSSRGIFHGASFAVTANTRHVTDKLLRRALEKVPEVVTAWPIRYYTLQAPSAEALAGVLHQDRHAPKVGTEKQHVARDSPVAPRDSAQQDPYRSYTKDGTPLVNPHEATGVQRLHAEGVIGVNTRIAIIDTGIDAGHPALGGGFGKGFKVAGGADLTPENTVVGSSVVGPSPETQCMTHGTGTASIAAGLPWTYGFIGVAPNATIDMYKVLRCGDESVAEDVGIKASVMAFETRPDVISVSMGAQGGWSNTLWSQVAKRINDQGVLYAVSAGNDGNQGPWWGNDIGGDVNTPNIASADNPNSPELVAEGSYSVNGGPPVPILYSPGFPSNWSKSVEVLYAPQFNGCVAMNVGAKPDQVVIFPRPWTADNIKTDCPVNLSGVARDSGIRNMIIYNWYDYDVTRPLPTLQENGDLFTLDGLAAMHPHYALDILGHAAKGDKVTLNLPWRPDNDNRMLRLAPNPVSGNRVSNYSTWGPTYETGLGPAVTAPGANLLMLSARIRGGVQIAKGTSFSAPYFAGVALLVKQSNPSLNNKDIVNRITATARPHPMQDNNHQTVPGGLLAPAFQAGAGLIDAYAAVHTKIAVNTSVLTFNDTAHLHTLTFNIQNLESAPTQLSIQHAPAATIYTFFPGSLSVAAFEDDAYIAQNVINQPATLSFRGIASSDPPAPVLNTPLGPAENITVVVTCTPPQGLDLARLPLLSGFVNITSSAGDELTVPYGLIGTALRDVPVLDKTQNGADRFAVAAGTPLALNTSQIMTLTREQSSAQVFTLPRQMPADPMALKNTTLPGWEVVPVFGSPALSVHVINTKTQADVGEEVGIQGSEPFRPGEPHRFMRDNLYAGLWTGQVVGPDGKMGPAGDGEYQFAIRMLRVSADANPENYDEVLTSSFHVKYV